MLDSTGKNKVPLILFRDISLTVTFKVWACEKNLKVNGREFDAPDLAVEWIKLF
jgi:hypothetical protein